MCQNRMMPKRAPPSSVATTATTATVLWATFGEALKFLRKRARLTQDELGRAVGYSREQIARLENNSRLPDLAVVAALFAPALNLGDDPTALTHLLQLAGQARESDADIEITLTRTVRKRVQIAEVIAMAAPTPALAPLPAALFPLVGARMICKPPATCCSTRRAC
ncbi:MAG: helix-turn-helix transcriptional regulator [Anaerolineae bacterium]|nr:helix-turn-helix transcriptional regulator [Anaerolineae bacterium]